MKFAVVFCVLSVAVMALARPEEQKYTDRYDNVNIEEILANKRLLDPYMKCILDKGKCAADAKELKEHIREALETKCKLCTDPQMKATKKVIKHLINNEKEYWNELCDKYDPDRTYATQYEEELKEIKA